MGKQEKEKVSREMNVNNNMYCTSVTTNLKSETGLAKRLDLYTFFAIVKDSGKVLKANISC